LLRVAEAFGNSLEDSVSFRFPSPWSCAGLFAPPAKCALSPATPFACKVA